MNNNLSRVIEIDINDILPNRNQPRIMLNEEDDLGLTDSIKEYGVLQPILVRSIGDKYEIIAGERRYRASVLAGKEAIPAIVINMNDKESAEVALIENIQRKQLSPIEEALSYKSILDKGYMTQEQLAEKIGKSQPTIANKIRLLNLSDDVQDALLENQISERHARSLLKLKDKQMQNMMLDKIITGRLTVRKTDEEIDKLLEGKGEENMNNEELNNMPQFQSFESAPVATPVPQFEMSQPSTPTVEPVNSVESPVVENPFGNTVFEPVGSIEPTPQFITPEPVVEPQAADIFAQYSAPTVEPTPVPQFDIFQGANVEPTPAPQFITPEPVVEPQAAPAPQAADIFAQQEPIVVNPSDVAAFEKNENVEPIVIPATTVNSMNLDEFTTAPVQENSFVQPEVKPEPIIITDYNKQYDPVMPAPTVELTPQGSFKDVIATIRECNEKIEALGYKVEMDEFDLTNFYQVIMKIEKM